jgi:hypothetical protein
MVCGAFIEPMVSKFLSVFEFGPHLEAGFLLTMAPAHGIDFIDRNLDKHLNIPREAFFEHEDISAIGLLLKLFSDKGTSSWVSPPYLIR